MSITGDQTYIKQMNKNLVLHSIRREAPLSRAQVSLSTGLNKGTVSSLVAELIDENLVYEIGPGKSSGGRRPVMLMFQNKAGASIGIDIGVNYISGVLTDLNGNVLEKKETALQNTNYRLVFAEIVKITEDLIAVAPATPYGVVGIGVGVPGIVDDHGNILLAPNLDWQDVRLKEEMEDYFQLPVTVENEANAGAYGEMTFGQGKDSDTMLFFSVGIGIGSGIIVDKSIFRGTKGFAGEVGHMSVEMNGAKCSCGNRGCWELYASEKAIENEAKNFYNEELRLEDLLKKADEKEAGAIRIFHGVGENLGIGIANMINVYNPDLVVIGNRIAKSKLWIENPLKRAVETRALPFHQQNVKIAFSEMNSDGIALGAAYLMVETFLA
nr:ROK family transcriptional regulator [Evansella caseinilytica]